MLTRLARENIGSAQESAEGVAALQHVVLISVKKKIQPKTMERLQQLVSDAHIGAV